MPGASPRQAEPEDTGVGFEAPAQAQTLQSVNKVGAG